MPSKEHVLGIDEGTTGVRAVVVHANGDLLASAYAEVGQAFPEPGWIEHDPAEIWQRAQDVIGAALRSAKLTPGDLSAVGVTNQRGTAVLFDEAGQPYGPAGSRIRPTIPHPNTLHASIYSLPDTAAAVASRSSLAGPG